MRGTIQPRDTKAGRVFDAIYRDPAGKQRQKTFANQRAAERFIARTVADRDADASGLPIGLDGATWIATYTASLDDRAARGALSPSTVSSYKSVINRAIAPFFVPYRTDRISHRDVATWTRTLAEQLRAGTMSPKTHNNVIAVWSALITWSRHPARRYVIADLATRENVERAANPRRERLFLEPDQIRAVLRHAAADGPIALRALTLAVYAGLRRGEIAGLQAGDVDHEDGQIRIRRAISANTVRGPKTASSIRTIDLPRAVLATFAYTADLEPDTWLFANDAGTGPIHPDWLSAIAERVFDAAGVPVRLHGLRHTYASILISHGEPAKYVSEQMGHASIQITQDLYGHLFKQTRRAAMDRLDTLIDQTPPSTPAAPAPARPAFRLIAGRKA